jgi:hypothetical protein
MTEESNGMGDTLQRTLQPDAEPAPDPATSPADSGAPFSAAGPVTDRDAAGRFVPGNRAALVVGARSAAFWAGLAAVRRDLVRQVIQDAGYAVDDAPKALQLAVDGLVQATLLRDSAFERVVESGGPMTSSGRTRRAYAVWLSATDRVEKHVRLVGLSRVPGRVPSLQEIMSDDE